MKFAVALLASFVTASFITASAFAAEGPLAFDPASYAALDVTVGSRRIAVRAWENVPYVGRPVDPEV